MAIFTLKAYLSRIGVAHVLPAIVVLCIVIVALHSHISELDDGYWAESDDGALPERTATPCTSPAPSAAPARLCNYTIPGQHGLVVDDRRRVCRLPELNQTTGCCAGPVVSDDKCVDVCVMHCCTSYELCVACCPAPFMWCAHRCRTSAASVNDVGHYRARPYCYRESPTLAPSASATHAPTTNPSAVEMLEW